MIITELLQVFVLCLGVVCGAPQNLNSLDYDYFDPNPSYDFAWEVNNQDTFDEKSQQESLKDGTVTGSYSYLRPDGKRQIVTYRANDEIGFVVNIETVDVMPPFGKAGRPKSADSGFITRSSKVLSNAAAYSASSSTSAQSSSTSAQSSSGTLKSLSASNSRSGSINSKSSFANRDNSRVSSSNSNSFSSNSRDSSFNNIQSQSKISSNQNQKLKQQLSEQQLNNIQIQAQKERQQTQQEQQASLREQKLRVQQQKQQQQKLQLVQQQQQQKQQEQQLQQQRIVQQQRQQQLSQQQPQQQITQQQIPGQQQRTNEQKIQQPFSQQQPKQKQQRNQQFNTQQQLNQPQTQANIQQVRQQPQQQQVRQQNQNQVFGNQNHQQQNQQQQHQQQEQQQQGVTLEQNQQVQQQVTQGQFQQQVISIKSRNNLQQTFGQDVRQVLGQPVRPGSSNLLRARVGALEQSRVIPAAVISFPAQASNVGLNQSPLILARPTLNRIRPSSRSSITSITRAPLTSLRTTTRKAPSTRFVETSTAQTLLPTSSTLASVVRNGSKSSGQTQNSRISNRITGNNFQSSQNVASNNIGRQINPRSRGNGVAFVSFNSPSHEYSYPIH